MLGYPRAQCWPLLPLHISFPGDPSPSTVYLLGIPKYLCQTSFPSSRFIYSTNDSVFPHLSDRHLKLNRSKFHLLRASPSPQAPQPGISSIPLSPTSSIYHPPASCFLPPRYVSNPPTSSCLLCNLPSPLTCRSAPASFLHPLLSSVHGSHRDPESPGLHSVLALLCCSSAAFLAHSE